MGTFSIPVLIACLLAAPQDEADRMVRAAAAGDTSAIARLLDAGVDVNARSRAGVTALHAAKVHGHTETVQLLLSKQADPKIDMPPTEQIVDAILSRYNAETSPGAAVLVARDGKVLYEKGFGYANLEHRVKVTPATKFRIGSVTKQFTAAAILKLAEDGKLKTTDKLSVYLPDAAYADQVTIHHLLTHTSGIPSYTSKPDFMKTVRMATTPDELIATFKNDKLEFEPGKKWVYSNSGYFLLGHIIEKVSGQSYGEYLKSTFFQPLGMKDTGVHHWSEVLPHEAHGYSYVEGKSQKAENWDMSRAGAAGALYSTVGDLHRWNEAVFGGKALNAESLQAAFTPVRTADDSPEDKKQTGYGYGWGIGEQRGLREISHNGGLHGFNSSLLRMEDQNFTVAVLCNSLPSPPGLDAGSIAHELATLYLWEKMNQRPVQTAKTDVSGEVLEQYVGRYDYGAAVLEVTRDDARLFAQLTGQPKYEIFPKSETEFFWKVVEAQVTFVKDEAGKVVKAVHKQGGQTIHAARIKDTQEVKLDAKVLDAYVGKYMLGPATLAVTKEENRLYVQLTGQPKFECFAKSKTEFFLKAVNAQLTFVAADDGKVTEVVLEQGGNKHKAPRIE